MHNKFENNGREHENLGKHKVCLQGSMISRKLKITILGSGTSQGVPVIACSCAVCCSEDPRDKRLRCSILLEVGAHKYVVDTGPDFRQQMLREGVQRLDGVLFTHEHKDHLAGLDDVRAFNFIQRRDMPIYCTARVEEALRREFHYVFAADKYPGIPALQLERIHKDQSFVLPGDIRVLPVEVLHYKMPVLGFRIGDFSYITDAKTIADTELQKLKGTRVLIVNALRKEEHLSHFNLQEALNFIADVAPEKAYLTHISHLFGKQLDIEEILPKGVFVAYDGMKIEIPLV